MKLKFYTIFFLASCLHLPGWSQSVQTNHFTTNNSVEKVLHAGNVTYVAGTFSNVGYAATNLVELNSTTGVATNRDIPAPNDVVRAAVSDGSGGWYIGGDFTQVGGVNRRYLARINADGSLNAWNPNPDQNIWDLKVDNGLLYVGGQFNNIGGLARRGLAAYTISTGALNTTFHPEVAGSVYGIHVSGTDLYIGGYFSTVKGATRTNGAAVNKSTGAVLSFNANANSSIRTIAEANGIIYIGGDFSTAGGQSRMRIASYTKSSGVITTWNPGSGGTVYKLAANNSKLFVTGFYNTIGGQSRRNLASFDLPGGTISTWNPASTDGAIYGLTLSGNRLLVGLETVTVAGSPRAGVAEFDATTGALATFNPCIGGYVFSIATDGTKMLAAGRFSTVNGSFRNGLAAFDVSGNLLPLDLAINGAVYDMAIHNNKLYLAGSFYGIGAANRMGLASVDLSNNTLTSWDPQVSGQVKAIAISASTNTLFVGGDIYQIGSQSTQGLGGVDLTTGAARNWNPQVMGHGMDNILALAVHNNKLYAGGDFFYVSGENRYSLVAFDVYTLALDSWNPQVNGTVKSLAAYNNTLFVGGYVYQVDGQSRTGLASFSLPSHSLNTWAPITDNGGVNTIAVDDNKLYIGGYFETINGQSRRGAARYDLISNAIDTWSPLTAAYVQSIYPTPNLVYLGGQSLSTGTDYRSLVAYGTPLLLPVRWLSFNGIIVDKNAQLQWSTADESNTSGFAVERSTDGKNFTKIGTVSAYNSRGTHFYNYADAGFDNLVASKVYYRITQFDIDGKQSYSKIISLGKTSASNAGISPNPVQANSRLTLQVTKAEQLTITITGTNGILVKQFVWKAKAGFNSIDLQAGNLATGAYIVTIKGNAVNEQLRFIK